MLVLIRDSFIEQHLYFHLTLSANLETFLTKELANMKLVWLANQCCQYQHKLNKGDSLMKLVLKVLLRVATVAS